MAVEYRDRMSESDALLWNNERDPMLRSTILCVMLLDRAPDEARFPLAIERALARIPRLRQRVVLDPFAVAPPRWSPDPHFDLAYHVRRIGAPGKGALRELLDLAAPIGMQAFDKDRPLWELYLVEGIEQGRNALLLKLHHSISDGVGLVRMTSSLVERTREPDPGRAGRPRSVDEEAEASPERGPFEETLAAIRYRAGADVARTTRLAQSVRRGLGDLVRDPLGALRSGAELAGSDALFGSMLKAIDFVTSNVPGPPFPVYVAGARVLHMFGFGPLSGAAANVTLFSYDGELNFGVNTDPAAVREPELFVECLERGVAEVLAVG